MKMDIWQQELAMRMNKPDEAAAVRAKQHWDAIAKPLDGMGKLETVICQIAAMTGSERVELARKAILVMCADNGVIAQGVTQTDSSVTAAVTENFARGIASVNLLAQASQAEVIPVDIGVRDPITHPGVLRRRIADGTADISKGPAMTAGQLQQAVETGIALVEEAKKRGIQLLGTGEMGIGNTTTTSAVASVLLHEDPQRVTGRGAGLSKEGLAHKTEVIRRAIAVNAPDPGRPLEIMRCLGGFDIAGMVGIFLGGAIFRIPVVVDGAISAVAGLLAERAWPGCRQFALASHLGKEPVCERLLEELQLDPILHAELALGEGTGCALLFPLLDMALQIYQQNHTFEEIAVEAYQRF